MVQCAELPNKVLNSILLVARVHEVGVGYSPTHPLPETSLIFDTHDHSVLTTTPVYIN